MQVLNFFHTDSRIASIWQIAHANVDSQINVNKIYPPPAHYHSHKVLHHNVGDAKRVESDFTRFSKVKVKFIVVQAWIKKRPDGCWLGCFSLWAKVMALPPWGARELLMWHSWPKFSKIVQISKFSHVKKNRYITWYNLYNSLQNFPYFYRPLCMPPQ